MKKCCIVIVTYNAEKWLDVCLKPFVKLPKDMAVVVVDNMSNDKTVKIIKKKYNFVKLFEMGENLGFGRANNIGIRWAYNNGFEHIFLLNQDAEIDTKSLYKLCKIQDEHSGYFCLSPMQYNSKNKLDKNFENYLSKSNLTNIIKKSKPDVCDIEFANAALWMLSRKCIETVGGFNPSFLHYSEDSNYVQRIYFHGGKMGVAPGVNGFHYRGESSAKNSHFATLKSTWRYIVYDLSNPYITNNRKYLVKWYFRLVQRLLLSVVSFNREKISIYYSLVRKLNSEKKEIYKNKTISQTKGAFLK